MFIFHIQKGASSEKTREMNDVCAARGLGIIYTARGLVRIDNPFGRDVCISVHVFA